VLDFVDPDGSGSAAMELQQRYLYGAAVDQVLAQEDVTKSLSGADRVLWFLADNLGTTRDLIDNAGVLAEHYQYDAYGQITSGDTSLTRYLYTAREHDPQTGLQYNRARWHDPAVGRWLSEDPIGFAAGDGNLARYVRNMPTCVADPSGLEATLAIYINTANMPNNFDRDAVQAMVNQISANSRASILLIESDRPVPSNERGWEQDVISYFPATGWWNLNIPLQPIVNGIHDVWTGIGDYFSDNERFYVHAVEFVAPNSGAWIAHTPRGSSFTEINLTGLNQEVASLERVDWPTLYANILMHEVVYLGLLGYVDNPAAPANSLGSGTQSSSTPVQLLPTQVEAIERMLMIYRREANP
jgi:RHS repeat-associated protein